MNKPKFYILNIQKCNLPFPGPAGKLPEILIMDGQYFCDFDVVEEALPVDVCNYHRYETETAKRHLNYWLSTESPSSLAALEEEIDFMPLGINRSDFPLGYTITEVSNVLPLTIIRG